MIKKVLSVLTSGVMLVALCYPIVWSDGTTPIRHLINL